MNRSLLWSELLDLFIQSRAAATSDLIEEPEELGPDDEWLFIAVDEYINKLSTTQFLDLIEEIVKKAKAKYQKIPGSGSIVFGVASEIMWRRPPKFYCDHFPDPTYVSLDLSEQEEKKYVSIILNLKKGLSYRQKYKADSLVKDLTGKSVRYFGEKPTIDDKYWRGKS